MSDFVLYSPLHVGTALSCAGLMLGACIAGLRLKATSERRLRVGWTTFVVAYQIAILLYWLAPARIDLRTTLPLHVCDLVVWAIPFAFFTNSRLSRALLYFWGIGLSSAAFVWPILDAGPAQLEFWLFWMGHLQIVGSGLYLVVVQGYRPKLLDVGLAVAASVAYASLIVPLNLMLDSTYGMLGRSDFIEAEFGPWPSSIAVVFVLQFSVFFLLWFPWAALARRTTRARIAAEA